MDGPSSPNDSKRPRTMTKQFDLKLRCPIRAHADKCVDDGEEVGLPVCRKDQTFKAIDKLKYVLFFMKFSTPSANMRKI